MRVAIVGYGSLIWDLDNLAPFVKGNWQMGIGPQMPIEFSRVSPKRKKALVLVIDETLNHKCNTCIIESSRSQLDDTVEDLANRERCDKSLIGYVCSDGSGQHSMQNVAGWLEQSKYDAVIWTALPGNFELELNQSFNHQNGRDYLRSLKGPSLKEAWRYIEYAPIVTDTPFRRFLAQDSFWQSLDYGRPEQ